MAQGCFRTGSAARSLGISAYHLRRLCETGLIRAQMSPRGQWQISASEIERLRREGVPAVPQGLINAEVDSEPADRWVPEEPDPFGSGRSPESSAAVAESADAVTIAKNQLVKRTVDLERELLEDRFRERERQGAAQNAARALAARQQWEREREARHEQWWRDRWRRYALQSLPQDTPPAVKMNLPEVIDEVLSRTDHRQPWYATRPRIDAAVAQVLGPYRRQKEIDRRIEEAVDRMPWGAKNFSQSTEWQLRAAAAARQAVRQLPADAAVEGIELAVRQAVDGVVREFEQQKA